MKKNKFIYILSKTYECVKEESDLDEVAVVASTDIYKVLDGISYSRSVYSTVWVVEDGKSDFREISIVDDAGINFRKNIPTIYDSVIDKEEIGYVEKCLTEWCNRRDAYLAEEQRKIEEERKRIIEERERKEYERLKKKFERE